MPHDFTNQTILVAGGAGGLGRGVLLAFLAAGAKVIVTYRKPEEFAALQADASAQAASLFGVRVDLTDAAAVSAAVDGIVAEHGRLDAMVNTVGGYAGGAKLWELDPAVFDQQLSINLRTGFLLARAVVPHMLRQQPGIGGQGSIVNVASRAAVDHAPGAAAYVASKAAAVAMMDSLAAELRGTGVRANSVLPSIIDTPANRRAMPKADFASWPTPEQIARVILFLCSPQAELIHGAAIPVYGAH